MTLQRYKKNPICNTIERKNVLRWLHRACITMIHVLRCRDLKHVLQNPWKIDFRYHCITSQARITKNAPILTDLGIFVRMKPLAISKSADLLCKNQHRLCHE